MKKNIFILLILAIVACVPLSANAVDLASGRGIIVSPGVFEEWMSPGETVEKTISITNNTGKSASFEIEIEDFEASGDPKISNQLLGENGSDYSLKEYLFPEFREVSIDDGQTIPLKVSVSIPTEIESPGLYGAILIRQKMDGVGGSMNIIPRVGVLFYIGIRGNFPSGSEMIDLKYIPKTSDCKDSECLGEDGKDSEFEVFFQNNNKTHISLFGDIEIKNLLGKTVDVVKVNPWFVMADSYRVKEAKWEAPRFLFGRYQATLKLNDYHSGNVREKSIYFWVIQWPFVLALLAIAVLTTFILNKRKSKVVRKNVVTQKNK